MLAGALTTNLLERGIAVANDEALMAISHWHAATSVTRGVETDRDPGVDALHASIETMLTRGRGGRNVIAIGLRPDIADAAWVDRFDLVAELSRDPLRILATRHVMP